MVKQLIVKLKIKGALRKLPEEEGIYKDTSLLYPLCLAYTYELISNTYAAQIEYNEAWGGWSYMNSFEENPPNLTITILNSNAKVILWGVTKPDKNTGEEITNKGLVKLLPSGIIQIGDPANPVFTDSIVFAVLGCSGDNISFKVMNLDNTIRYQDTIKGNGEWDKKSYSLGMGGTFEAVSSNMHPLYIDDIEAIGLA